MDTIKLSKEEIVKLVGLRKAKVSFPDMFKNEEAMHTITNDDIPNLMTVASGDVAPAKKYSDKSIELSLDYHWSIVKRQRDGKLRTYLIPIKKDYAKKNPLNKLRTAANFGKLKKVAAKRKKRAPKTQVNE
jgi:hypothetical protein